MAGTPPWPSPKTVSAGWHFAVIEDKIAGTLGVSGHFDIILSIRISVQCFTTGGVTPKSIEFSGYHIIKGHWPVRKN